MAQFERNYGGASGILQRAVDLMDRDRLHPPELAALLEGGRVCTRHGVKLMAEARHRSELLPTLAALVTTSDRLLNRVRGVLDQAETIPLIDAQRLDLVARIEQIQEESFFLACWIDRLAREGEPNHFDA